MFSFGSDQDDAIFDQLRSIRPFTVDQLYLIHPDVGCPPKSAITSEETSANDDDEQKFVIPLPDKELYQNLVEYEQLRDKLVKLKQDIKSLCKKTHEHIDKAWVVKEETVRRIAMCQQGKIAETKLKYNTASVNKGELSKFSQEFAGLIDLITKDYIYYSFESQAKHNRILAKLSIAYQLPDLDARKTKLKSCIVTIFEFLKCLSDSKPDFVLLCRKWLRVLCKRYLDGGSTRDYRFVVSLLARSPVGTADWSADIIECKPYEQVSGFESVPQYITHCSTLLSEFFYNIQTRIKQISVKLESADESEDTPVRDEADQNWSLVDPRFSCTEELSVATSNPNLLSETDVIKFCLRIPIAQIFRAHVKQCLDNTNGSHLEIDKNYELVMLKLLTIGTVIIKTYQVGLETFNSIQYGSLIEYLSSQIRRTVLVLSDQWSEFKRRLRGIDDALVMRLQVEYDNFMLRSILIILELRQSGIWRHLSRMERHIELPNHPFAWSTDSLRPAFAKLLQVTGLSAQQQEQQNSIAIDRATKVVDIDKTPARLLPKTSSSLTYEFSTEWFKDVSEPMLWHILWQFYSNAFVSSCDYHSDYYWLHKFQEKSVVYLFVNKIKDSSPGECSYLLNSITSMLLSRTKPESKLVNFIATEIFNLTFNNKPLKEKVALKGMTSLIRCAEKFPNMISLYLSLMQDDIDEIAVELIKSCSLRGWICDESEFTLIESWLIEQPLSAPKNKIARLVISKLLLNSPIRRLPTDSTKKDDFMKRPSQATIRSGDTRYSLKISDCFVDLKMRRKLALILYHASIASLPENNQISVQSLGASVEVAFGAGLFGTATLSKSNQLLELATDSSYQQFYVWTWRILFALKLHILDQIETDWNDVQIQSGTSRSTKNTVLIDDPFYPVPSIDDAECQLLADGVTNHNPIAAFIYLFLTDVTWHHESWPISLMQLNILADAGHITPSLMAMKFFAICHLNDLNDRLATDKKCLDYFRIVIISNFDATRLASLIMSQLNHLKQYRQLQLSHFYIKVLLDVSTIIAKQISSSWFSRSEVILEKIACILDFIARFNFTGQRIELIRKFYSSSMAQDQNFQSNGWLGSFLISNSPQSEFPSTNLHILARKFKKYTWLQWVTTECDALRLEKVWEDVVAYLSTNEDATLDSAIKKVCPQVSPNLIRSSLPIFSWIGQIFTIMESDLNHPLCPLIWYNFYLNYFANSLNGVSVGFKLVSQETLSRLTTRLDSLYNYHTYKQRNWTSSSVIQQNSLTQLYRAYKLWLQDPSLRDAYVDISRLKDDYLVPLLKAVIESSNANACLRYIDLNSIETQNKNLIQVWTSSTQSSLNDEDLVEDPIIYVDNNDLDESAGDRSLEGEDEPANDAVSMIVRSQKTKSTSKAINDAEEDLSKKVDFGELSSEEPIGGDKADELITIIMHQCEVVFEESGLFSMNISELKRTKTEIIDLALRLYVYKKREFVRVVACSDGNECIGPARIQFEAEEAILDERNSQCVQDRRRHCQELLGELMLMPKNESVKATMLIEKNIRRLVSDPAHSHMVTDVLLKWLSKPDNYKQLDSSYYVGTHLLKTILEILSNTDQIDSFNRSLVEFCLEHPESVHMISPHLSPCSCSPGCFLDLYKAIQSQHLTLGPMVTFVLLSKFDVKSWLATITTEPKDALQNLIETTCSAFDDFSKEPDKSYELTMDLFRRHLQVELAPPVHNKQKEFNWVLKKFLTSMYEQKLQPSLWLDFLTMIGLNLDSKQEGCNNLTIITESVARLAESQTVFNHDSLCVLVSDIRRHMEVDIERPDSPSLVEFYRDYVEHFGLVILSVSFMWIKSTSESVDHCINKFDALADCEPDPALQSTWQCYFGLWEGWILSPKSCLTKSNYNLMVDFFIVSLHYMIHKIPGYIQAALTGLLSAITLYVEELKDDLGIELSILQRCLKNLPWSSMLAKPSHFRNLILLTQLKSHNMSDLASHIMLQVNIQESLTRIHHQVSSIKVLIATVEDVALIIIRLCHQLVGLQLPTEYLGLVETKSLGVFAQLSLSHCDFLNTRSDELLFRLLKCMCFRKADVGSNELPEYKSSFEEGSIDRFEFYANFVSNYLVELTKRAPVVQQDNEKTMRKVINNTLKELEPILLSDCLTKDQRIILYGRLMDCCNTDKLDEESRIKLAKLFAESDLVKSKPRIAVDLLQSIGHFTSNPKVLVHMTEWLTDLHLSTYGQCGDIFRHFQLYSIELDQFLETCIREICPMALMVYFESRLSSPLNEISATGIAANTSQNQAANEIVSEGDERNIWAGYFYWLSRMISSLSSRYTESSTVPTSADKMATILMRLLIRLEVDLQSYVCGQNSRSDRSRASFSDSIRGGDNSSISSSLDKEPTDITNNGTATPQSEQPPKSVSRTKVTELTSEQKCLLDLTRHLASFYDSLNPAGLWSYLKSTIRSERSIKISVTSLAVACFLADRSLIHLTSDATRPPLPAQSELLHDELAKTRRTTLAKLEVARKSKSSIECAQFIDSFIESVQQNSKVQYGEVIQLMVTFVLSS